MPRRFAPFALIILIFGSSAFAEDKWVHYEGRGDGPGKGKHIVLISGDEEYRSEEALPQLGKILSVHHGFDCTVLFSQKPETAEIDPENQEYIPGLQALESADMMIVALRFRELPDSDMKFVDDFVNSGKPMLGLRTSTHAFRYNRNKKSPYAHYSFNARGDWPGGFGQEVLGDTWINHHGHHKVESTRGIINGQFAKHPILRGVEDVWGPTDVYGIRNLPPSAHVLMFGAVLTGMKPTDPPIEGKKNNPLMPLVWTKGFTGKSGKESRVINTTMGAATDLESEGFRRLLVNAVYWGLEMEEQIPGKSMVDIVGNFEPTAYGFGTFKRGVKPSDHRLDP